MSTREFVYPGSFDPFTKGHLDIVVRASKLCDVLHVVILVNPAKKPEFSVQQRIDMIRSCLQGYTNIKVTAHQGLLVDYMKQNHLRVVVRGLRSESDFRFETEMAATNMLMYEDYDTVLIPSKTIHSFTSSSIVREIASYGGDISKMVPEEIIKTVEAHFAVK